MLSPELRLYDTTGARQPLPDKAIVAWRFELLPKGGCGAFSLSLKAKLDDTEFSIPQINWRFEVWFDSICAYRGWFEKPSPEISNEDLWKGQGAGLMGRLGQILVDCAFAKPYGADISEAFGWIASHYLVGTERLGEFAQSVTNPLGYTIEKAHFFGQTARSAFDKLAEAGQDLVLWGFDTTPEGNNRLYVVARPTTVVNEDYRFRVAKDVIYLDQPEDLSEVANAVRIIGRDAKAPNLVYNPSFEIPTVAGSGPSANLLGQPSFEAAGSWTYGGGSARQQTGGEPGEYARSGQWFAEIDAIGEYIEQTVDMPTPGANQKYLLTCHLAKQNAATNQNVYIRVQELDSGGSVLSTIFDEARTVSSRSYTQYRHRFHSGSASAAKLRVRVYYDPGGGTNSVLVDDVWLHQEDSLGQQGWSYASVGTGLADIDWANHDDPSITPYHGLYCILADVSGTDGTNTNTVRIRTQRWCETREKTSYRFKIRVRVASGTTRKLRIGFKYKQEDEGTQYLWDSETTLAATGSWETVTANLTLPEKVGSIQPIIELRHDGLYWIDAVDVFESGVETRSDFLPGEQLEFYFRADDTTTLPNLSAAAQASITTYGLREQEISVPAITDIQQAKDYATGWLNRYAVPPKQGTLELAPAEVFVRYVSGADPPVAQGMVAVSGAGSTIPDQFPARIEYSLASDGTVRCAIELTNRRPDQALLILKRLGKGGTGGGGGGRANLSPSAGGTGGAASEESAYIKQDGTRAWTGNQSLGGNKITNSADPSSAQDLATKAYVDSALGGARDAKESVRAASTANVNISSAPSSIDGVTLANGDRVLLKDQTTASENGIRVFTAAGAALNRASDADTSAEVTAGLYCWVEEGTTNADKGFLLTTNGPITLDTTGLTFVQVSGLGQVTAGQGLSKTGDTLDVNVDGSTLEINSDTLRVKDAGITAAKLSAALQDLIPNVNITVGTVSANVKRVSIQFRDAVNNNLSADCAFLGWLCDDAAAPAAQSSGTPNGGSSVTAGALLDTMSTNGFWLVTNSSGLCQIEFQQTGARSWQFCVLVGNQVFRSSTITFT